MKILFDQGTPAPLRHELPGHEIHTAFEMGWSQLSNGDLLQAAEPLFDLFITTDQNLHYQQKFKGSRVAILVLPTTRWPTIRRHADRDAQEKYAAYAAVGIPQYIIINLRTNQVEVHSDPDPAAGAYRTTTRASKGESLRIHLGAGESLELPAADVLP